MVAGLVTICSTLIESPDDEDTQNLQKHDQMHSYVCVVRGLAKDFLNI